MRRCLRACFGQGAWKGQLLLWAVLTRGELHNPRKIIYSAREVFSRGRRWKAEGEGNRARGARREGLRQLYVCTPRVFSRVG